MDNQSSSIWSVVSHSVSINELQDGDHIYKYEWVTTMHGIFFKTWKKSENVVIHLQQGIVQVSDIQTFLNGAQLRRARYSEGMFSHFKFRGTSYPFVCDSPDKVRKRASLWAEKQISSISYFDSLNSEAFAVYCKTGKAMSAQGNVFGIWGASQAVIQFSPDELSVFSFNEVQKGELLGKGAFGDVFKCTYERKEYAGKFIEYSSEDAQKKNEIVEKQVSILKTLNHKNILQIKGYSLIPNAIVLFMDLFDTSLCELLLKKKNDFPKKDSSFILKEILEGLAFLHENLIAHRDLKPANILIKLRENNPIVQLSDFDTVLQFKSDDSIKKAQTIVGTIKYLAPEIRNADECEPNDNIPGVIKGYDPFSADIWSFGVILKDFSNECFQEEVRLCLNKEPQARPNSFQLLERFKKISFE